MSLPSGDKGFCQPGDPECFCSEVEKSLLNVPGDDDLRSTGLLVQCGGCPRKVSLLCLLRCSGAEFPGLVDSILHGGDPKAIQGSTAGFNLVRRIMLCLSTSSVLTGLTCPKCTAKKGRSRSGKLRQQEQQALEKMRNSDHIKESLTNFSSSPVPHFQSPSTSVDSKLDLIMTEISSLKKE